VPAERDQGVPVGLAGRDLVPDRVRRQRQRAIARRRSSDQRCRHRTAQDDVALAEISSKRLFTALPQSTAQAEPAKVRVAANAVTDAPLKGSIDASARDEARIEHAIDQMVEAGAAEVAATDAPAPVVDAPRVFEKPVAVAAAKDPMLRPGPISVYISRKLGKLFEDPTAGPLLKANLATGMTALPTWMWVFLKPLVEGDTGARRRHIDDDRGAADDDDAHMGADHDRHRQRRRDGGDDQHHAAVTRPKRKLLSAQKKRTAKRGTTRAAKA
jgi:hypothetical protein